MAVNLFTNGAGGNTWGTAGNWSQGTIPTAVDGHVTTFDATSPNCTMGAARSCNAINFTGYTNTLTMSTNILTVSGNVTLDTGLVISGTGAMYVNATCTFTSNAKTWPNELRTSATVTITLVGDLTVGNFVVPTGITGTSNSTTAEIIYAGNLQAVGNVQGTAPIVITGGSWNNAGSVVKNVTLQGNITISGTVSHRAGTLTYVSGTITTTGSTLQLRDSTLNTAGVTWNNISNGSAGSTWTLTSNLVGIGLLSIATANVIINTSTGSTISAAGLSYTSTISGTAKLILTGGTWSGNGTISNSIDVAGNLTISGTVRITGGTFTYISGTISWISSALLAIQGSMSFDTSGVVLQNTGCSGGPVITLVSDWYVLNFAYFSNGTITPTTSQIAYISGAYNVGAGFVATNSADVQLITGATWLGTGTVNGALTFNGNATVSGSVTKGFGTLKRTSGTITTTSSTLSISNSATLDTAGMTWNNVTLSNTTALTYTINSSFDIGATLTLGTGAATIFTGTTGWTCATLSHIGTTASTITLKEAITYTVTTLLSCFTTRTGSILLFTSAHGTTRANLVLTLGATCRCRASLTRIDATGGRPIRTFNGTLTDCVNMVSFSDLNTVGSFVGD